LYARRNSDYALQLAIAAVVSRMWTYHAAYDDMILFFVMAIALVHALRQRTVFACAVAIILGMTLWPPKTHLTTHILGYDVFQLVAWTIAFLLLISNTAARRFRLPNSANSSSARIGSQLAMES